VTRARPASMPLPPRFAFLLPPLLLVAGVASASPGTPVTPASAVPREPSPVAAPAPDSAGARAVPLPADKRRTVGLLDVRVEGLSDEIKDNFRHELEEQIDTKRFWLADLKVLKAAMMRSTKWTEGCLVGRCLAELRTHSGAELVLLTALTGSGTSFGYVVTLVRTDTGSVVDQESDRCDVCTVSEVMKQATLAAVEVLNNAPDKLPDEASERAALIQRAIGTVQRDAAARAQHQRRVGMALLAAGIAGAVTGGALYLANDSRPGYAVATAAGGVALAASGVVVLTF